MDPAAQTYTTSKEVFDKIPERFADVAANMEGNTCFHFSIGGGGDYLVRVDLGELSVRGPRFHGESDLKIGMSEEDFLDIVNGKENLQLLFMCGRIRVDGDLQAAMQLVRLFCYTS